MLEVFHNPTNLQSKLRSSKEGKVEYSYGKTRERLECEVLVRNRSQKAVGKEYSEEQLTLRGI